MTREIKFRAWDGVLHEYRTIDMNSGKQNLGMGFEATEGIGSNTTTIYHSFGDVVEQYIGLHDKNSKPIFEGDIVHCVNDYEDTDYTGEVMFFNGGFCVYCAYTGSFRNYFWEGIIPEVVGNVHENMELLGADECQ